MGKTAAHPRARVHGIRAVERAAAILKAFSPESTALGVTELSRRLGLHKSTVHRLLAALEREGFVVQDPGSGHYRLGLQLFELGSLVVTSRQLQQVAHAYLEQVHHACGETVHLAILDEGEVVYVDKLESTRQVRMYSLIGRRSPAHCTGLGKVLLAWLPEGALEEVIRRRGLRGYTSQTITSAETLRDHLALVRQRGYAIDNGEHEELIRCAAAPVFDYTGQVVAAVSIAAVGVDVESRRFQEYISLIQQCTRAVSEALGNGQWQTAGGSDAHRDLRSR
ncbi:MAG TPA: IclR family transcriptional regulator [bacterium]|nr:IclR family transcriptional regulator [bacterium]